MLKSAFLLINIIGFVLFPFLYIENVSVDHKLPAEIKAGEEIIVEIILSKQTVSGPARLKLDFSNATGITASEVESAGASFTFKDNAALFIWYSIPADEVISLKYKLSAAEGITGAQSVSGSFSFVDGDERRKVEIPISVIEVKGDEVATTTENDIVVIDSSPVEDTIESPPNIVANRTVETSGDNILVTVSIDKSNGEGFARLKEVVPPGFKAESVDAAGAVYSYDNGIAKFLWSNISGDNPVVVAYKLIPEEQTERGTYALEGTFSAEFMVVNDVPTKAEISMTSFIYETGSLASVDNTTADSTDTTADNTTTDNTTTDNTTTDKTTTDNTTTDNTTTDNTTTDNKKILFKVQIVASHKNVSESDINKHYGINETIALESHQGWVKYTVGGYNKYKSARDKRQKLSPYDLPGPFVTAYNAGERISVQEALMVANQDWIK